MDNAMIQLEAEIELLIRTIASLASLPLAQEPLQIQLDDKRQQFERLREQNTSADPTSPQITPVAPSVAIAGQATIHGPVIAANQGTVNVRYGPRAEDPEVLLREYLGTLSGECNRLSLADADSSDPTRAVVELAAVYTGLEVATSVGPPKDKQPAVVGSEQPRQLTVIEAMASFPRLVLLGVPGGGKSTVLNFIGLCLAQASMGEVRWLERLERWPHGTLIPIRIVLRELAAWIGIRGKRPTQGSAALVWEWLVADKRLSDVLISHLRHKIVAGNTLLLLDGLDEVPVELLPLVLQTIQSLADVAVQSRIVVSCRILDYQQPSRQLPRWPTETIIPFSQELQRTFIARWFLVLTHLDRPLNGDPEQLRDRLQTEVVARPELGRLAGNPLLLTMMTRLHAYEGRLPGERVRLYEKCVDDLLHTWRKHQRESEDQLGTQLKLPGWGDSDLGRLLDRLGYAAHQRGISSDGESGADLTRRVLIDEAQRFFAAYDQEQDYVRAQTFVRYVARYSNGLLQQYGPDTFRFPHRTFQEYLAARRLVSDDDWPEEQAEFLTRALLIADAGPQWREVLLLAISQQVVVGKQTMPAAVLVEELLSRNLEQSAAWARDVTLAGEVLTEVGRERMARLGPRRMQLWDRTVAGLVTVLEHLDSERGAILPTTERIRAGHVVGQLGDPRFPATMDEWQCTLAARNERFGQPDGYFCYVQPGNYQIGGWKKESELAELSISAFWIARYPITVTQYHLFLEQGGYTTERWWTPEGWKYCQKKNRSEPWRWNESVYAQPNQPVIGVMWYEAVAFCNWLNGQLGAVLPDEYMVRLPTEAEWEVAAYDQHSQRRTYPWGDQVPTSEYAIYDDLQLGAAAPVGCCPAGAASCGALDLAGNVWEWTTSAYNAYPQQGNVEVKDFTSSSFDVSLRGGAYYENSASVLCGTQFVNFPIGNYFVNFGFRIVVARR